MTRSFSTYLDLLRFFAALTVFLGHASTGYMTGGIFWQLAGYGDTCVIVFFVLSGFVIGYVTDTKDRTWALYTSNRAARLWSVVLPALVLTFVVDFFGVNMAPRIYDGPWYLGDDLAMRYLASALMLQEIWHVWLVPGINGPFWSLTYEAVYYLVFGILMFSKSKWKWLQAGVVAMMAGPLIVALAPIWAVGYGAYVMTTRMSLSAWLSATLFLAGTAILLMAPSVRIWAKPYDLKLMGDPILARYIDTIGISANILGAYGLCKAYPNVPHRLRTTIAAVAGSTFVLYLFHRPLIQLFSFIGPSDQASWQRRLLVLGGTFALCYLAVPLTEKLRSYLRHRFYRIIARREDLIQVPG